MAIIMGLGSTNLPEGHYQPILLIGHLGIDLKNISQRCKITMAVLPFLQNPNSIPLSSQTRISSAVLVSASSIRIHLWIGYLFILWGASGRIIYP
jgi:hypothetical protein